MMIQGIQPDGELVTRVPAAAPLGGADHDILYEGVKGGYQYLALPLETISKTSTDGALKNE